MNVNYMREPKPFRFAHLQVGESFQVEGNSNLYMKISVSPGAVNLSNGAAAVFDTCEEVIPCPDAIITRKQ